MATNQKKQQKRTAARKVLLERLERLSLPFHNLSHARTRAIVIAEMIKSLQPHEKQKFDPEKTDLLCDCAYFSLLGYCESSVEGVTREQQSSDALDVLYADALNSTAFPFVRRMLLLPQFSDVEQEVADSGETSKRRMLTVAQKIYLLSDDYAFLRGWDAFVQERLCAYAENRAEGERSVDDFFDEQMRLADNYLRPMVAAMDDKWENEYRRSLLAALDDIGKRIAAVRCDEKERLELEARLLSIRVPVQV